MTMEGFQCIDLSVTGIGKAGENLLNVQSYPDISIVFQYGGSIIKAVNHKSIIVYTLQ